MHCALYAVQKVPSPPLLCASMQSHTCDPMHSACTPPLCSTSTSTPYKPCRPSCPSQHQPLRGHARPAAGAPVPKKPKPASVADVHPDHVRAAHAAHSRRVIAPAQPSLQRAAPVQAASPLPPSLTFRVSCKRACCSERAPSARRQAQARMSLLYCLIQHT